MTVATSSKSVGVVIPTRDRVEYLAETIESVLEGTRTPDEFKVVDNSVHRPAETKAVCLRYGSRVQYVAPIQNLSMQANHNRAIQSIDSDLCCVVHDDDTYGPDFLRRGTDALTADPTANLFVTNYSAIDGDGKVTWPRAWSEFPSGIVSPVDLLTFAMKGRSPIHLSAAVMRTTAAKRFSLHEVDGNCADMGFFFPLVSQSNSILLDEPLVNIRVHSGMESTRAGYFRFDAKRISVVRPIATLEWRTKRRFLESDVAASALGLKKVEELRRIAAKRAVDLLLGDARNRSLLPWEQLRLVAAAARIFPETRGRKTSR